MNGRLLDLYTMTSQSHARTATNKNTNYRYLCRYRGHDLQESLQLWAEDCRNPDADLPQHPPSVPLPRMAPSISLESLRPWQAYLAKILAVPADPLFSRSIVQSQQTGMLGLTS